MAVVCPACHSKGVRVGSTNRGVMRTSAIFFDTQIAGYYLGICCGACAMFSHGAKSLWRQNAYPECVAGSISHNSVQVVQRLVPQQSNIVPAHQPGQVSYSCAPTEDTSHTVSFSYRCILAERLPSLHICNGTSERGVP